MHSTSKRATVSAIAAAVALVAAGPALAKCQKMAFLVNDYGKDGPTKDAQDLLDKHIVKWSVEQGITKYTVSKKDVKCELFLDFVVFDEHTCTAEATVCWNEPAGAAQQAKKTAPADASVADKPEKQLKPAPAAAVAAEPKKSAPETVKAAAPATRVETGTVPKQAPVVSTQDVENAEKAAAAAERAAAAAERAAQAAERAAQAAEDLASNAPVQKYAAPAAVDAVPSVQIPEKEKVVAPVPPR